MRIDHLAIWVEDLDKVMRFYMHYFNAVSGEKYHNPVKKFTSYFLRFGENTTRLEIMQRPDVDITNGQRGYSTGITHFAIAVDSKEVVNDLTERLRQDGYTVFSEPRTTGDGYYESVVLDPEGNHLEITV